MRGVPKHCEEVLAITASGDVVVEQDFSQAAAEVKSLGAVDRASEAVAAAESVEPLAAKYDALSEAEVVLIDVLLLVRGEHQLVVLNHRLCGARASQQVLLDSTETHHHTKHGILEGQAGLEHLVHLVVAAEEEASSTGASDDALLFEFLPPVLM